MYCTCKCLHFLARLFSFVCVLCIHANYSKQQQSHNADYTLFLPDYPKFPCLSVETLTCPSMKILAIIGAKLQANDIIS